MVQKVVGRRTWLLIGLLMAGAFGAACVLAVAFAFIPWLGPWPSEVAALQGATEAEFRADLGDPGLVLRTQGEFRVLTFCYNSLNYKWLAGKAAPRPGWIEADELPPVTEKAYWYESKLSHYLLYFNGGRVSQVYIGGT